MSNANTAIPMMTTIMIATPMYSRVACVATPLAGVDVGVVVAGGALTDMVVCALDG